MGRKHDEIWQELCDLDNRVTRLEELTADLDVTINTTHAVRVDENGNVLQEATVTHDGPQVLGVTTPRPWRVGDVVRLEDGGYRKEYTGSTGTITCDKGDPIVDDEGDVWIDVIVGSDVIVVYWPADRLTLIRPAAPVDESTHCANGDGTGPHSPPVDGLAELRAENARDDTDTHTARLIDIAPISDHIADPGNMMDERKGDRRVPSNELTWVGSQRIMHGRRFSTTNDRRRTPGTRADRKAGSNE